MKSNVPVLDIFVLSLLERGAETPYDLQRQAGLSLGATLPALKRLVAGGYVSLTKQKRTRKTQRPRHSYVVTTEGAKAARTGWKPLMSTGEDFNSLDAILRLADLAAYYGEPHKQISQFLTRMAQRHMAAADAAAKAHATEERGKPSYRTMRWECESARLFAVAQVLYRLAGRFERRQKARDPYTLPLEYSPESPEKA